MSINKVILVGNVGKDPETRHLENGSAYSRFTLATNEYYTDKSGQKVTQTEWHNIVVWRQLSDLADKYIRKGSQIYVEGKITTRSYDDKETGAKKYITEIVGLTIQLLGSKSSEGQNNAPSTPTNQNNAHQETTSSKSDDFGELNIPDEGDGLPF